MGEIGIPHDRFLYGLRHWEIQAIIRGYRRRQRSGWEQARFNAYYIMTAMCDMSSYKSDRDIYMFPWEQTPSALPSKETVAEMQELIKESKPEDIFK